ncbi:hypothetical protein [Brachybacterium saurashtrense]|uniref:ESX secretion-associated protein EspG n=1 Tax=Brachybacterium saurashtrense TaxID=556288 RepID=A0A345YR06_9MICO|nr:hypothetical protein [Brachybacterium saurashtrense]AXK46358.1 hypothetical protein DWV08_12550 [Brachybacterium saurashtrense]RRR24098.1 hypothetical protein DXU92_04300 [Brachybacterium saurashtrense]
MSASSPAPAPDPRADCPDLPAGISGTDPGQPLHYTPEDVAAARALLDRVRGGDGPEEAAPVVVLSDEQISALDGYARRQFVARPWAERHLDQDPDRQRLAAAVALRGMLAAGQVLARTGPGGEGPRWRAVPEISGCLVLRRTAESFTTAERTVQTGDGPQVHRLHCFTHPGGVLEEEVTADGLHRFTVLTPASAAARLAAFLDPAEVAGAEGDPVRVRSSALPEHPFAARLAQTRALTVLTLVRTGDGSVQQLSAYATADGVLTMEALDPAAADPPLEIRAVDGASLRALATVLVGGGAPPQPGA